MRGEGEGVGGWFEDGIFWVFGVFEVVFGAEGDVDVNLVGGGGGGGEVVRGGKGEGERIERRREEDENRGGRNIF